MDHKPKRRHLHLVRPPPTPAEALAQVHPGRWSAAALSGATVMAKTMASPPETDDEWTSFLDRWEEALLVVLRRVQIRLVRT